MQLGAADLLSRLGSLLQTPRAAAPAPTPTPEASVARPSRGTDRVEISSEARAAAAAGPLGAGDVAVIGGGGDASTAGPDALEATGGSVSGTVSGANASTEVGEGQSATGRELTPEEQEQVDKLEARDREVRAHEQAHKAAGGQYAGPISYTYTTGPDSKRYATGGSVPIDASPIEGDPQATIRKMQQVRAAANAPAEPSAADRQVAAAATREITKAQQELSRERLEESRGGGDAESGGPSVPGSSGGSLGLAGSADATGVTAPQAAPSRTPLDVYA